MRFSDRRTAKHERCKRRPKEMVRLFRARPAARTASQKYHPADRKCLADTLRHRTAVLGAVDSFGSGKRNLHARPSSGRAANMDNASASQLTNREQHSARALPINAAASRWHATPKTSQPQIWITSFIYCSSLERALASHFRDAFYVGVSDNVVGINFMR